MFPASERYHKDSKMAIGSVNYRPCGRKATRIAVGIHRNNLVIMFNGRFWTKDGYSHPPRRWLDPHVGKPRPMNKVMASKNSG